MLLKLLSVDSFVVAHSLVWVMNLPTMLRLRVLHKACYDFITMEDLLWYRRKVELWNYEIPKSWWRYLPCFFQHASQLVLNSNQLGYTVSVKVPQTLVWIDGKRGRANPTSTHFPFNLQSYVHTASRFKRFKKIQVGISWLPEQVRDVVNIHLLHMSSYLIMVVWDVLYIFVSNLLARIGCFLFQWRVSERK